MCPIAPVGARNNLVSSTFVPTMRAKGTSGDARTGPGSNGPRVLGALDRRRGDDLPVDHRLPGHHAGHHLNAPALQVGTRGEIGLQLRLRRKQAIDWRRNPSMATR
jgi:hypothetical protein